MNWKVALFALALAAPLGAQETAKSDTLRHPMMGASRGMMMDDPIMQQMGSAMMRVMLYAPQHLLARKDAIGLTADQVTRLTALRDGAKTARDAAMTDARAHMKELDQSANAALPDTAVLKTHFQAAHAAMGKAHWAMLASAAQARVVLTDAQRTKVQAWADSMQAWMQQHDRMMNPARPH
jgi:LTXXQ motif family protein